MRWMNDLAAGSVAAGVLAAGAGATVSSTLVADAYIVREGAGASARFYAVLDVYVKGNHLGDNVNGPTGLSGVNPHQVVFATNKAEGVTRDAAGRIVSGSISSDVFVQSDDSSWNPNSCSAAEWDSFVTCGSRNQCECITVRAGNRRCQSIQPASGFTQFDVARSNFINNGSDSGWWSALGSNGYSSGGASENPFGRISLYNSYWDSTYPDLDRTHLKSRGELVSGSVSASSAWSARRRSNLVAGSPGVGGVSLADHWMLGRFSVDVTSSDLGDPLTLNVQFNMFGKNGTSNETGSTFTGATTASYRVSQFFAFAKPCLSDLDRDRLVDNADLSLILLDYGSCAGCASDLDGNGTVDFADVALLLLDFGPCPD